MPDEQSAPAGAPHDGAPATGDPPPAPALDDLDVSALDVSALDVSALDVSAETHDAAPESPEAVDEAHAAEAADVGPADGIEAALAAVTAERDEYLDQAQRSRAEFQNLKRRTDGQLAGAMDRGAERLCMQLLGALDNFGYVLDAAEDDDSPFAKGVRMVHTELRGVLAEAGLTDVPASGEPFDPEIHEALMSEDADEPLPEPVVSEVLRPGYRFKGRTLRAASVKVLR